MAHTRYSVEMRTFRTLCMKAGTAYALRLLELDPREWQAPDAATYTDVVSFGRDLACYSFLRKWKGWQLDLDREKTAFGSWLASEKNCFRVNRRIQSGSSLTGARFLSEVMRKIESVIGPRPPEDLFSLCRWSVGATFDIRRVDSDHYSKMSSKPTSTSLAAPFYDEVCDPVWYENTNGETTPCRGSRGIFVPKDFKTDRFISAEPTLNGFLQQSVGRYIRSCLYSKSGINLNDQSINRKLAREAHSRALCTVDLSSASDSISLSLVELLLPYSWAELLNKLRSPSSLVMGHWYRLEKHSPMGNAYTFELESLIFWAIASTCVDEASPGGVVSVFGDDIIIPVRAFPALSFYLNELGFTVNPDKSFTAAPFFESCGGQYYSGLDVTPAYQKEVVSDLPGLLRLYNRLFRLNERLCDPIFCEDALLGVFRQIEKSSRGRVPRVPVGYQGDEGILSELEPRRDGDYDCEIISSEPIVHYLIGNADQVGGFAYKLRHPTITSCDPVGFAAIIKGERRRRVRRRIWRSSLVK